MQRLQAQRNNISATRFKMNFMKPLRWAFLTASSMSVGGQAVIEGVMMRSPHSMAVAVRRSPEKIIIKEFQWVSLSDRFTLLKKPVLRGMAMLIEALMNGMQALSFSAEQAALAESEKESAKSKVASIDKSKPEVLTQSAIVISMIVALGFGVGVFVVLPHLLTDFIGRHWGQGFQVNSFKFHLIDGLIKMTMFISYILAISRMNEIKRVFQYHGAEHKSIFAYEKHLTLNVENARVQSRFHPRCGTSFVLTMIMASILVFSSIFPFLPKPNLNPILTSLLFALIKIPLMLPVVGLSYEFIRAMGKESCPTWLKTLSVPGMWMQNLTTQEPDDTQLEVGLASLKACLWREENLGQNVKPDALLEIENIKSPFFETQLASRL
jgi:uncharacterized protein YqhQ